ncbi:MAG: flavodoxin family protein [Spirochaetales bacterium]|nr:flavodoxin family protein [Spirochaetales bacterium]
MKILVTYYSRTGNTRKVAEAISETIGEDSEFKKIEDVTSFENYDLIFIGFPVYQFGVPRDVKKILNGLNRKKVACFITHAMPENAPLFGKQIDNCKSALAGNEVIEIFSCQGELSEKTAMQMANSENESMRTFAKMRKNTLNHPDKSDLDNSRQFARFVIESL